MLNLSNSFICCNVVMINMTHQKLKPKRCPNTLSYSTSDHMAWIYAFQFTQKFVHFIIFVITVTDKKTNIYIYYNELLFRLLNKVFNSTNNVSLMLERKERVFLLVFNSICSNYITVYMLYNFVL